MFVKVRLSYICFDKLSPGLILTANRYPGAMTQRASEERKNKMNLPPVVKEIGKIAIVAIAAVYLWNTFAAPRIAEKTGKDLTA